MTLKAIVIAIEVMFESDSSFRVSLLLAHIMLCWSRRAAAI